MMCPLCKNECAEKDLNTFQDYADYLYAQLCIQTVKLVSGELSEKEKQDLALLLMCSESISKYTYEYDRTAYGFLDTPKNESSQKN